MFFDIKVIKHKIIIVGFYIFRIFPISKNKVVVSSFAGKSYGAEGKFICDEILKRNKTFDIVWLCNDTESLFPDGIRPVKYNTIKAIFELATAKVWVDNRRKDAFIRKRTGQFYIQTWHGNVCIKKVEKDALSLPESYFDKAKADSKMADVFVSGSIWRDINYRNAFWYDGEIIRGDLYSTKKLKTKQREYRKNIRDFFGLSDDEKIVLYAPTFRQDSRLDCYSIDYNRLLKALHNKYGGSWKILIRLHPNVAEYNQSLCYDSNILNASLYPQVNDLIAGCDILISDYSGVIFEGFRLCKRVILYAADLNKYLSEERGLYFDFRNMPSPLAENNDELECVINSFDDDNYENNRRRFVDNIGYYENDAIKLVVDRIEKIVEE